MVPKVLVLYTERDSSLCSDYGQEKEQFTVQWLRPREGTVHCAVTTTKRRDSSLCSDYGQEKGEFIVQWLRPREGKFHCAVTTTKRRDSSLCSDYGQEKEQFTVQWLRPREGTVHCAVNIRPRDEQGSWRHVTKVTSTVQLMAGDKGHEIRAVNKNASNIYQTSMTILFYFD